MASSGKQDDEPELLFFDTFSHDINEELNLDLVQFPKPVYITEVRIIPLGARVEADFPGGVRLGATNPSEFHVDFFVNDLGKPGASSFENLGSFEYNQNDCINLECSGEEDETYRQIPTDGLVLRGWYTTITLAVYGTFTKQITEPIASPPVIIQPPNGSTVPVQITTGEGIPPPTEDWDDDVPLPNPIFPQTAQAELYGDSYENREYQQDEFISDIPKDPRSFPIVEPPVWTQAAGTTEGATIDRDWDLRRPRRRSHSSEKRAGSREISRPRDKSHGRYSRSSSPEREYRSVKRDWSRSPTEYRAISTRSKPRGSPGYGSRPYDPRSPESEEPRTKRPRTPPMNSPRRPRSPEHRSPPDIGSDDELRYRKSDKILIKHHDKIQPIRVIDHSLPIHDDRKPASPASIITDAPVDSPSVPILEEDQLSNVEEQFEPILSDDDIGDDPENQFELDYDFSEYEDVIKIFNPFVHDLIQFEMKNEADDSPVPLAYDQLLAKELEVILKLLRKFHDRCDYFQYTEFTNLNPDSKECWVQYVEQFIQMMSLFNTNAYYYSRNRNNELIELLIKDHDMITILIDWIRIGLNFDMSLAQPQPGYKIRHIKAGIRLIEMLLCYDSIAKIILYDHKINIYEHLFNLYDQKYMALSIKLMIIKAIYSSIDCKRSIEYFLSDHYFARPLNGYKILLIKLNENPLTRVKFSIKSLIKKINFYESLKIVQDVLTRYVIDLKNDELIEASSLVLLQSCLSEILNSITFDEISYMQPKRFLPVSSKFDITKDVHTMKAISIGFLSYFKITGLLESLLMMLTYQNHFTQSIVCSVHDVITALMNKQYGLEYFYEHLDITNVLVKLMIGCEKNSETLIVDSTRCYDIGIEMWFKMQTKHHLIGLINLKSDTDQLVEYLHSFYSLVCNQVGKPYVIETICLENNIDSILNIIDMERKADAIIQQAQGSPGVKTKSPVLNYAVDLIDLTIRNCYDLNFLEMYGVKILDLVKNHELFESSVSAMFQEMAIYMKPLEIPNVFSYNDITGLCELIKRSIEFITTFPGDLIMGLRIIRYLGIPPYDDFKNNETDIRSIPEHVELRYKFVILDFYSHDGVTTILSILDKLTTFFEQPAIHSSTLGSSHGVLVVQILLPAIEILRKMLTYVIKCRNTAFKDLTAIEPLLKTYNLLYYIPNTGAAYRDSKRIQNEIIKILLAYTQPSPPEGVDTESVHKSLWTQMIGEIIKYILIGPYTFIPGLLVFSELLPLPLPILTKEMLSQKEVNKITTERQLWSAHLHPQTTSISEMIQTICVSSYPQLILLLSRVCLQLADLAPNMTLLVSKSMIDLILNEINGSFVITQQLTRLLRFISSLVGYSSVKVSVLSIISGRLMDFLSNIMTSSNSLNLIAIQAEENVNLMLQNLLDCEISMIAPEGVGSREMTLACALPSKEIILSIAHCLLENFMIEENKVCQIATTLRTLMLLTEHDFTIFHLRVTLDTKVEKFYKTLKRVFDISAMSPTENQENFQLVIATLEFLVSLICINDDSTLNEQIPPRTIVLSPHQFQRILSWKVMTSSNQSTDENTTTSIDSSEKEDLHPLKQLKIDIEKVEFKTTMPSSVENNSDETQQDGDVEMSEHLPDTVQSPSPPNDINEKLYKDPILENLNKILNFLDKNASILVSENSNSSSSFMFEHNEPILPQAEGIVTQYGSRQFYSQINEIDDRLNVNYWLSAPNRDVDENDHHIEQIPCDLTEVIKTCLPSDTNLTSECKRLLHLSASPQTARERTATAPCYRTRRVEVEPTTGRPEKKIFVTPMRGRGFPRTPPSRGDLFRSRPPNTSRPPSLHVDDFLALETCGAQPTGPTGYNKLSREIISIRGTRGRGRGFSADRGRIPTVGAAVPSPVAYRQAGPWPGHMSHMGVDPNLAPPQHFRTATSEPVVTPHFPTDPHYQQGHFGGPSRGRIARGFVRGRPFQR